jgi:hypothetical protein
MWEYRIEDMEVRILSNFRLFISFLISILVLKIYWNIEHGF